jgi:pyruvate/2-oxoacid:ferredoxin oxidoreductase beta subunit
LHQDKPHVRQALSVSIKAALKEIADGTAAASGGSTKSLTAKAGSMDMFRTGLTQQTSSASNIVLQNSPIIKQIQSLQDHFVRVSMWIWGGDGWAYDIGFGGLDHVVHSNAHTDFNVLIMDTEGYSNTGGQVSKATNLGSVQKFAPAGHVNTKKDLGAIAMSYEHIFVGSVSMGADYGQCVKTLVEAEAYDGPSIILA